MVFSDLFFLFIFLPSFAIFYLIAGWLDCHLLPKRKSPIFYDEDDVANHSAFRPRFRARNTVLTIFSLIFYAWGEPIYIFLMLFAVVINWIIGLGISAAHRYDDMNPKVWLWIGVTADILILASFKYLGFFDDTLQAIGLESGLPHPALPIGISFYIFQSISYLVDVYRKDAPAQRNYFNLLLYISMFPQLIAGPIVRYNKVAHEIHNRRVTPDDFAEGAYRFFIGLGKKVVLANILSEVAARCLEQSFDDMSTWGAWIGVAAYALQIYFDFSGYSDMAIGMGRAMGFHFNENFNHPYCADSVTDFWRRWHISLGSFFRDYAYIPMGGNRRHQMINLMTVWFLTGMWHGAAWNFIMWGLYFGFLLIIEKYAIFPNKRWIPRIIVRLWALMAVLAGWGIFYYDNFDRLKKWASVAFTPHGNFNLQEQTALTDYFWIWIVALILCMPVRAKMEALAERRLAGPTGKYIIASSRALASTLILILCIALLVGATNNAFIYTRF